MIEIKSQPEAPVKEPEPDTKPETEPEKAPEKKPLPMTKPVKTPKPVTRPGRPGEIGPPLPGACPTALDLSQLYFPDR